MKKFIAGIIACIAIVLGFASTANATTNQVNRPADLSGDWSLCAWSNAQCIAEASSGAATVTSGGNELQLAADGNYCDGSTCHTAYVITDLSKSSEPLFTYCDADYCTGQGGGNILSNQTYFTTNTYVSAQLWWVFSNGYIESTQALSLGGDNYPCADVADSTFSLVYTESCVSGYGGNDWQDNSI